LQFPEILLFQNKKTSERHDNWWSLKTRFQNISNRALVHSCHKTRTYPEHFLLEVLQAISCAWINFEFSHFIQIIFNCIDWISSDDLISSRHW
jgi:hypothetical protein